MRSKNDFGSPLGFMDLCMILGLFKFETWPQAQKFIILCTVWQSVRRDQVLFIRKLFINEIVFLTHPSDIQFVWSGALICYLFSNTRKSERWTGEQEQSIVIGKMGLVSILVHLIGVASFALVIWHQLQDIPIPLEVMSKLKELGTLEFGGNWKYLTFWNLWLQLFYFGICLINDILGRTGQIERSKTTFSYKFAT